MHNIQDIESLKGLEHTQTLKKVKANSQFKAKQSSLVRTRDGSIDGKVPVAINEESKHTELMNTQEHKNSSDFIYTYTGSQQEFKSNKPIKYFQYTQNIFDKVKLENLSRLLPLKLMKTLSLMAISSILTLVIFLQISKNYSLEKFTVKIFDFYEATFISEKAKKIDDLNKLDTNISVIGTGVEEILKLNQNKTMNSQYKNRKINYYMQQMATASLNIKPLWHTALFKSFSDPKIHDAVHEAVHEILDDEYNYSPNSLTKDIVQKINDNRKFVSGKIEIESDKL